MKTKSIAEEIKKAYPDHKVFEVTIKRVYMVDGHSYADKDTVEKEWFGTHIHNSHAHRDVSLIGGSEELIDVKEITSTE